MLEMIKLNKKGAEIATALYVWLALILVAISALVILSFNENLTEQATNFNLLVSDFGYKERFIPSVLKKMADDSLKEAIRVKKFEKLFSEMMNETTKKANEIITKELSNAESIANAQERLTEIEKLKSFEHFKNTFEEETSTITKEKIEDKVSERVFDKTPDEVSNLFDELIDKKISSGANSIFINDVELYFNVEVNETRWGFELKIEFEFSEEKQWQIIKIGGFDELEIVFKKELEFIADGRRDVTLGNLFAKILEGEGKGYRLEKEETNYTLTIKDVFIISEIKDNKLKRTIDLQTNFTIAEEGTIK
mgnify:CR=1 FL=1